MQDLHKNGLKFISKLGNYTKTSVVRKTARSDKHFNHLKVFWIAR